MRNPLLLAVVFLFTEGLPHQLQAATRIPPNSSEPIRNIIRLTGDMDFGNVTVGHHATRILTIHNDGDRSLVVMCIDYPNGYSGDESGETIEAGRSHDVTVTFVPTAAQYYGGNLTVLSDATSGEIAIPCSGVGAMAIAPTGLYLVVDLSDGPSASSYPVRYMHAVPSSGWTEAYKADQLVLRRVPAGTFVMGSPEGELGRSRRGLEIQHQVTLAQDFYIGVFEVTQRQWVRVMGDWPSFFANITCRDTRPVENVSYEMIRGSNEGSGWPANINVDATSFMGRLRSRTGLNFDLPTESQWEYAARAGTATALNSGKNLTATFNCPNMSQVGRYKNNHPSGYSGRCAGKDVGLESGTAQVGSFKANAWGLYDTHGNVSEWCLDWRGTYPGTVTDPKGPSSGSYRVARGGFSCGNASQCRSALRGCGVPDYRNRVFGFRAALLLDP